MRKRILYKTAVAVLAACTAFPCVVPIYAAGAGETGTGMRDSLLSGETGDSAGEDMETGTLGSVAGETGTDLDSLFASMKESLQAGEPVSLSGMLNALGETQVSMDSMLDLSSLGLDETADIGAVNLQYSQLAEAMTSAYESADLSSISTDCISILNEAYGNLLGTYALDEMSIPDSFSVSSYISQASSAISEAYGDAMGNSRLSSVKNSINTSDIFAAAAEGMTTEMPELESSSSLTASLSRLSASNKVKTEEEYSRLSEEASASSGTGWEDALAEAEDSIWSAEDKTPFLDNITGNEDSKLGQIWNSIREKVSGLGDKIAGFFSGDDDDDE